ncbi:MAG: hypothetical protein KF857_04990 [Fimbriimonadaceae bacterium]|nr:hypothetical protein [Fimbriimonadaceae bacterium]
MDAQELCRSQCDSVGAQLDRAFADLPAAARATKLYPDAFSPGELPVHLAECAVALETALAGEKYAWGSYVPTATDFDGQMAEYKALRARALDKGFALGTDEALKLVTSYIVLHDAYHVGQLCALRTQVEGWDSEKIYG